MPLVRLTPSCTTLNLQTSGGCESDVICHLNSAESGEHLEVKSFPCNKGMSALEAEPEIFYYRTPNRNFSLGSWQGFSKSLFRRGLFLERTLGTLFWSMEIGYCLKSFS